MKKCLKFAVSPCPNDTFIFGGLLTGKIYVPFEIDYVLKDVEELNNLCVQGEHDVIKVSAAVYPKVKEKYLLLSCGGAMGRGCGPIIVSKKDLNDIESITIGIPGKNTTAFAIFLKAFPNFFGNIVELRYDEIIPEILKGRIDAGILIHEARFTYLNYGLKLVIDLGKWWEDATSFPIPLGCILAKKDLGDNLIMIIEEKIRQSISYAENNLNNIWPFIKEHAQEMDDEVIKRHIHTFVNEFSWDLREEGKRAVYELVNT